MTLQTDKAHSAETILKRSVCLLLTCGYLGNSRKVDLNQFEVKKGAATLTKEKKAIRASKQLVDSKELAACNHEIAAAQNFLAARSAARGTRIFGPGTYLIPITDLLTVVNELKERQARLAIHAEKLAERWDAVIKAREADLGPLFNAKEFPTKDDVIAEYKLDWRYVSFEAPELLAEVDQAVWEAAQAQNQQMLASAYDEVVVQLRAAALKVMTELVERLKPGPDGKKKALHKTALRDLQDFISSLPHRNIAGDSDLDAVMKQIGDHADGIDVDVLKKADAVRESLLKVAESAAEQLDHLVSTASTRAIAFGSLTAA